MAGHTRDLSLRINYDINNQELRRVDREMDSVISTARDMDRAFQNNAQNTQKLETKQKELQRSLGQSADKVKELKNARRDAIQAHGAESAAVETLNRKINDATKTQEKYKRELKDTERQLQRQDAMQNSIKNIQTMTRETEENVRSLKNQGRAFAAEGEQLRGLNRIQNEQKRVLVAQRHELNRLTMQYGEHDDRVKEARREYERLTTSQNRTENSLRSLNTRVGQTNPRLSRMSDNLGAASRRLDHYSRRLGVAGNKVRSFGQDVSSSFGVAALAGGAAVGYSLKKAMDFEQGMTDTESLMSKEEWAQDGAELTNLVKQQGAATKFSSVEAAMGLQELVKAGVSTQDILNGGLKDGLNLATAGGLELAKAAEVMSTSLNAFSDKSVTSTQAANLLAGAANASATDVQGMAYGLSQSAAVMNTVGFTLEETTTALAQFAQAGLKGSDGGTSLKTMMLRLSPQTKEAADMMQELGLASNNTTAGYKYLVDKGMNPTSRTMFDLDKGFAALAKQTLGAGASNSKLTKETDRLKKASGYLSSEFYDQSGKVKPLQQVFELLNKSTKNLSKEQKINALNVMFGSDAIRAASIAAEGGAKSYKKMNKAMSGVTAADVAKKKMETLKGAIEYMSGSIETLVTDIGTALIPTFKKAARAVESVSDWFNKLSDGTKESIAKWGLIGVAGTAVVAALGLVSLAVGGVMTGFSGAMRAAGTLSAWMSGSVATYARSTSAITAETVALRTNAAARRSAMVAGGGGVTPVIAPGGRTRRSSRAQSAMGTSAPIISPQTGSRLARTGGTVAKFGKRLPVVGALLGAGLVVSGGTENLGGTVGSLAGGAAGGAATGALLGSVVPGVGTAIGGIIGGIAGSIGGEKFGSYLQKSIKKHWPKNSLDSTVGDAVSKDTKKAIKAYESLNGKATKELNLLAWSSGKITKENAKSLKTNYTNMAESIGNSIDQTVKKIEGNFNQLEVGGSLSAKGKKGIIKDVQKHYKNIAKETKESEKIIKDIIEEAQKDKRELTNREHKIIAKEQRKMEKTAVSVMTKSAKEQRTILSQLKADASSISAKQAASVVRSSEKARKGTVKEAEKKYKDTIAEADKEFYDNKSISKKQYDAVVASAKKTKEDTIIQATNMHENVVQQAKLQAAGQVSEVNWSTGKIINNWDRFVDEIARKINKMSSGINSVLSTFGIDKKIPMWQPNGGGKAVADVSKSSSNKGVPIGSYANGGYHKGGQAVVGEEGPELAYTPYGGARLVGTRGAEITNLESGTRILTASQTRQMMSGGLDGQMPGYAKGIGGTLKDAASAVGKGAKKAGSYVADKATDAVDSAKNIASNAYDFVTDPRAALDAITKKMGKSQDILGIGGAAISKFKDGAVNFIQEKLGAVMGGGVSGGPITNGYGVYDSLFSIAKTIMGSPLGKGLSITSGQRNGDPHDHGKHNAIDLSGFGSNGGYKSVAQWASKLPGVGYTIGDNTVFGKKYGNGSKPSWATGHMNHLHVSGGAGGSMGGSASSWSAQIKQAARQMKVKLSNNELNGIIAQIQRESNGSATVTQSSAVNDINMRNGNPAQGLLQYIPSTFRNYAMKGHGNITNGYDQLLAFFNNSNWRNNLPYGKSGWGPTGKRRFASGGWKNVDGQVLVGEEGPELVDLPNNSHVNNNTRTNEILNKKKNGTTINFSPNITINIEGQSNSVQDQIAQAVQKATEQMFNDLKNLFDSGVAY